MATQPDLTPSQPLQPGVTQPQPTTFPDPGHTGNPPPVDPNPLAPPSPD